MKPISVTCAVFTSYKDEEPTWNEVRMRYLVYQRELCPTTDREHWQGYVEFKRNIRTEVGQKLLGDAECHIEKRKAKTGEAAAKYCKKSETSIAVGNYHEFGEIAENGETVKEACREVYRQAHAEPDYDRAMAIIRDALPDQYSKSFCSISASLQSKKRPREYIDNTEFGWKLPDGITNWLEHEFTKVERARCLVLVGPTKLGKTSWARSMGHHMFWRLDVNFGEWDDSAKYIVIDEIPWKYIPKKKGILTHMGEITINAKYKKTRNVINNKPAIVLVNEFDGFEEESAYWEANTTVLYVTESLIDRTQKRLRLEPTIESTQDLVNTFSSQPTEDLTQALADALSVEQEAVEIRQDVNEAFSDDDEKQMEI